MYGIVIGYLVGQMIGQIIGAFIRLTFFLLRILWQCLRWLIIKLRQAARPIERETGGQPPPRPTHRHPGRVIELDAFRKPRKKRAA